MSSSHYVCYQNSAIVHFNITTLDHGYKTWKERYIKHFETLGNDDELLGQDPPQTANNIHPYNTMQKRRVINSSNVKFNRQKSFMSRNFHPKPRHTLRDQKRNLTLQRRRSDLTTKCCYEYVYTKSPTIQGYP